MWPVTENTCVNLRLGEELTICILCMDLFVMASKYYWWVNDDVPFTSINYKCRPILWGVNSINRIGVKAHIYTIDFDSGVKILVIVSSKMD